MKLKKRLRNISVYSALLIILGTKISFAEDDYDYDVMNPTRQEKPMQIVKPTLADRGDYEQQAKATIKIDKIEFPRYLKYKRTSSTDYAGTAYRNNAGFALKVSPIGFMYYLPNLPDSSLVTESDKDTVLADVGTKYRDYTGDLWWNYRRTVFGNAENLGLKIGSIDGMRNFKPSQVRPNTKWVENQWPKFPGSDPGSNAARVPSGSTADDYGSDILITETLEKTGSYSFENKYRNSGTRRIGNRYTKIKGEWRYLGANSQGKWVANPLFPPEVMDTSISTALTPIDNNWKVLTTDKKTIYNNKTATGDVGIVRDRTLSKFVNDLRPKLNGRSLSNYKDWADYFVISVPYGDNVSGILHGYWGATGNFTSCLMANGIIDLEARKIAIIDDKGNTIYTNNQSTGADGVVQGTPVINTGSTLKLQPGKEYTLKVTVKNRAVGHTVYNPTVNILLDTKNNGSYDFVSTPSKASAYGVYVMGDKKSYVSKKLGSNTVVKDSSKGYFSVNGERLLRSNGQKVVPEKNDANTIAGESSKVITAKFKIDGAKDETEMLNKFATKDPNAVQMRFAGQINNKHAISDNVFYQRGIKGVDTSIDDLYNTNNTIAMKSWSSSQDLAISSKSEYTLKDSEGNVVTSGLEKGKDYKLTVKVKNGSKIWGTSIAPKVDYKIVDAATGNVVVNEKSVQASAKLPAAGTSASSAKLTLPINIPVNTSVEKVRVEVNISKDHNDNYDDWYEGNNKFTLAIDAENPVDLKIQESMGDIVGDGVEEITVFSGETVNLMSLVSSNVNYVVGPVKVKFTKTPDNDIVEKQIDNIDMNNSQEIGYTFKAPIVASNQADKIYTITAEVNPEGPDRIRETNYSNNKIEFKVKVTGDISRYSCTSIVRNDLNSNGRPTGNASGNTQKVADVQYTSYVPTVTVKRRNIVNGTAGSWYSYEIQLRDKQLKVPTNEIHKIEEVLFKSKFTTDRYAEKLDRDKINSDGFVDILRYPKYARVKAGYGFEIKVKTSYKTNIKEAFDQAKSSGMDTVLYSGKTVYEEVSRVITTLNQNSNFEINTDKSTMTVSFSPDPRTVTLNAENEVVCLVMPDGNVYSSIDSSKKLIERMARKSTDKNNVYKYADGVEWNYEFTLRNNGMGQTSRRYYIDSNTKNSSSTNKYYMRIGTNKLGIGGLAHAARNGVYDVKDVEIIVYGGREDDLKDTIS